MWNLPRINIEKGLSLQFIQLTTSFSELIISLFQVNWLLSMEEECESYFEGFNSLLKYLDAQIHPVSSGLCPCLNSLQEMQSLNYIGCVNM